MMINKWSDLASCHSSLLYNIKNHLKTFQTQSSHKPMPWESLRWIFNEIGSLCFLDVKGFFLNHFLAPKHFMPSLSELWSLTPVGNIVIFGEDVGGTSVSLQVKGVIGTAPKSPSSTGPSNLTSPITAAAKTETEFKSKELTGWFVCRGAKKHTNSLRWGKLLWTLTYKICDVDK